MNISNYLEEQLIRHTLGIGAYSNVTPVYGALLSGIGQDGTTYTEFTGSNYARQAIQPANLAPADDGVTYNVVRISWPAATANWGTVSHIAIFDAAAAGNMLWWGELPLAKYVATSAIFRIAVGDLSVTMDGAFSLYLRDGLLDYVLRNVALAASTNIYAGIGTAVSASNASLSEPSGGYSRVQITGLTQVANGAYTISTPDLSFNASGGNWGLITHAGIWDAAAAGNLLYALEMTSSRNIYNGDGLEFDASSLTVRIQ